MPMMLGTKGASSSSSLQELKDTTLSSNMMGTRKTFINFVFITFSLICVGRNFSCRPILKANKEYMNGRATTQKRRENLLFLVPPLEASRIARYCRTSNENPHADMDTAYPNTLSCAVKLTVPHTGAPGSTGAHQEDIYVASSLTISESLREIPKGQRQDACKRLYICRGN